MNTPCTDTKVYSVSQEGHLDLEKAKLYYKIYGDGDPIIILHGGPGATHHGYFLPSLTNLSSDYKTIFYDQRGSGKSVASELSQEFINMDQFIDDLEQLRMSLGIERFSLIGHSWGGLLAMHYALLHPDHLTSLILIATLPATSSGMNAFLTEYQRRMEDISGELNKIIESQEFQTGATGAFEEFAKLIFSKYVYNPDVVEKIDLKYHQGTTLSGFKVYEIFNNTFFKETYNLLPQLRNLSVPTLIIHGTYDPIPSWTAEEIASAIPTSQLIILEETGHFPFIEQSVKFFSAVTNFLVTTKEDEID